MSRARRRQDGTLRPTVRRYRLRKRAAEAGGSYVDPLEEDRFREFVADGTLLWNSHALQVEASLDKDELGRLLEQVAEAAAWARLRDTANVVRAIGMPSNHPSIRDRTRSEHRRAMRDLILRVAYSDQQVA